MSFDEVVEVALELRLIFYHRHQQLLLVQFYNCSLQTNREQVNFLSSRISIFCQRRRNLELGLNLEQMLKLVGGSQEKSCRLPG